MIVASDLQIVHDHFSDNSLTTGTAHGVAGGVVGRTSSQTLTNKAISLTDNTLTGTKAQFNTAITDADFATLTGTENLSAKTLTSPTINNAIIASPTITNPVITGASIIGIGATITGPTITGPTISGTITGTGVVSSTNILDGTIVNADINAAAAIVATKLTGTISEFNTALTGNDFATLAGSEILTNKTLTSPVVTGGTLNSGVALTVDSTELNKLDGVTTTTAELNILTGVTSTAAELNILDGVTSTAAEINLLDGLSDTGWDTDPGAIASGWTGTGNYARAKKFLGIVTVYLYLVRNSSTISNSDVQGNMTDTLVYNLDTTYEPTYAHIVHFDIDGKTGGSAIINEDGTVYLRSMYDEDSSILSGDSIRITATFIV
jgi:hypothetical protein